MEDATEIVRQWLGTHGAGFGSGVTVARVQRGVDNIVSQTEIGRILRKLGWHQGRSHRWYSNPLTMARMEKKSKPKPRKKKAEVCCVCARPHNKCTCMAGPYAERNGMLVHMYTDTPATPMRIVQFTFAESATRLVANHNAILIALDETGALFWAPLHANDDEIPLGAWRPLQP